MSRWIDADRLTRKLIGAIRLGEMVDVPTGELKAVLNDVLSAPSIDIVQCKDCRYRDPEDKKCDCGHDIMWQLPRADEWFCSDCEGGESYEKCRKCMREHDYEENEDYWRED